MKAAVIRNGKIANIIKVETLDVFPDLIAYQPGMEAGDNYIDNVWTPSVPTQEELDEQAEQLAGRNELASSPLSNITLGFTTFTSKETFPPINEQAQDLLKQYSASMELKSEVGKYAQLLIIFTKFKERTVV